MTAATRARWGTSAGAAAAVVVAALLVAAPGADAAEARAGEGADAPAKAKPRAKAKAKAKAGAPKAAAAAAAAAGAKGKARPAAGVKGKPFARLAETNPNLEVTLERVAVRAEPRPDSEVVGYLLRGEVVARTGVSPDGNYYQVRFGPLDKGWVDVVAGRPTAKALFVREAAASIPATRPAEEAGVFDPAPAPVGAWAGARPGAGDAGDAGAGGVGGAPAGARAGAGARADAAFPAEDAPPASGAGAIVADDVGRAAGAGPDGIVRLHARAGFTAFTEETKSALVAPELADYTVTFPEAHADLRATVDVVRPLRIDAAVQVGYSLPARFAWNAGTVVRTDSATMHADLGLTWRVALGKDVSVGLRGGAYGARLSGLVTTLVAAPALGLRFTANRVLGRAVVMAGADALFGLALQGYSADALARGVAWGARGELTLGLPAGRCCMMTFGWNGAYLVARLGEVNGPRTGETRSLVHALAAGLAVRF